MDPGLRVGGIPRSRWMTPCRKKGTNWITVQTYRATSMKTCTGNAHVLFHEHPEGPGTAPLRWTAGYRNSPPVGREVLPLSKTGILQTPELWSSRIEQTFRNPSKWTTAKWPLCCKENLLCWANQVRHSGDLPGQTRCSVFDSGAWWHNHVTGVQLFFRGEDKGAPWWLPHGCGKRIALWFDFPPVRPWLHPPPFSSKPLSLGFTSSLPPHVR